MRNFCAFLVAMILLSLIGCGGAEQQNCFPGYAGEGCKSICGLGTHWEWKNEKEGKCVVDRPPCGPGTHENNYNQCIPDQLCGLGTHANSEGKCVPDNNAIEICDGKDNDGDGQVDESDPFTNVACYRSVFNSKTGKRYNQHGRYTCQEGVMLCKEECISEICDGLDNDCDGQVDEVCAGTKCSDNKQCGFPFICSIPGFTIGDNKPAGECSYPCKTDKDCPVGKHCFWTWDDPSCPVGQTCPKDKFVCLPN